MRIGWQRVNRGGCIPRIAKVVDPVDIARVRAGVHASRCEGLSRVLINAQIAAPLFIGPATSVVQKIALTR